MGMPVLSWDCEESDLGWEWGWNMELKHLNIFNKHFPNVLAWLESPDTAVNTPELVTLRSTLGGAALAQSPHFAGEKMGSGRAGTGMQEQESQEVSILVTFLRSIYTEYSTYTSTGLCRGECCPWEATTESSRMGHLGRSVLWGGWCSLVGGSGWWSLRARSAR